MKLCQICGTIGSDSEKRCACGGELKPGFFDKGKRGSNGGFIFAGLIFCGLIWWAMPNDVPDKVKRDELLRTYPPRAGTQPSKDPPPQLQPNTSTELAAGAGCLNGEVFVENRSSQIWEQTRIEVNRTWEYSPGYVTPGRQPYMAQLFTRSDGTRLNLIDVICKSVDIHATVGGHRAHWNGVYR